MGVGGGGGGGGGAGIRAVVGWRVGVSGQRAGGRVRCWVRVRVRVGARARVRVRVRVRGGRRLLTEVTNGMMMIMRQATMG